MAATILALSACATGPQIPDHSDAAARAAWQRHRTSVDALKRWQLTGRVAIKRETEGWTAGLRWSQEGEWFDIRLQAPLGQGTVRVHGDTQEVTLRTAKGKVLTGKDIEWLLDKEIGWQLPITGLRYWVRGLPMPEHAAAPQWDVQGRLRSLQQAGWSIRYERYTTAGGFALPDKLTLTKDEVRLRLVANRWQVQDPVRPARSASH